MTRPTDGGTAVPDRFDQIEALLLRARNSAGDLGHALKTPLAVIESREAASLKGEVEAARARLALAQSNYAREQRLFAERVSPEQDLIAARTAAAEAMAATGLIPAEAARAIAACDGVRAERVDEIEQTTQHDMIAFTTAVAERVGPSARWLHFGLTSSDVLDTCFAIQLARASDLLLAVNVV